MFSLLAYVLKIHVSSHSSRGLDYTFFFRGSVPDPGTSIKVSATHSACLFVGGGITTSLCPGTDSGGYPVLNVAECKSCWHKICRKADGSYAADAKDCATTGPPKVVRDVWNGVHHGVPPGCSYRIHDLPAGGGYPLQKMGTKTFNRDLKSVGTRGDLTQVCKVKVGKKPKKVKPSSHKKGIYKDWCVRKAIHGKGGPTIKGKGTYNCQGDWHGQITSGDCFPSCVYGLKCQGGSAKPGHQKGKKRRDTICIFSKNGEPI